MKNYVYLIMIIFALESLSIQGMKNIKVKNVKRIPLFKKIPLHQAEKFPKNIHTRHYSASEQYSPAVQQIPIPNKYPNKNIWDIIRTDFTNPKRFFTSDSPFTSEDPLQTLTDDDIGKIKTDIDITFKRLENVYTINIPHLKAMIKNKDSKLEQYTPDFFKEKKSLFKHDIDEIKRMMKKKLDPLDNEALLEHLENAYTVTKRDIIGFNFGQAEGLIKRYRYDTDNPTIIQKLRNRLFGEKSSTKSGSQKRSYSTQKGLGYFSEKFNQPKPNGKRFLHITAAQEKIERQMQQDQIHNYDETTSLALDKINSHLKTLRGKIKALVKKQYDSIDDKHPQGKSKGIYIYMKHFDRYTFSSSAPNDQKVKIKILAARLYLLEEQLPASISDISLNTIEHNPFYLYMKNTFFNNIPKERFSQNFETFVLPQSADDFINTIHDMTWNSHYAAYTIPNKNNLVLDLYANALLAYILYKPKCTTKQFIQFCAFLNRLARDRNYREQQLHDLKFKEVVVDKHPKENIAPPKERGLWVSFLSALGKLFPSSNTNE